MPRPALALALLAALVLVPVRGAAGADEAAPAGPAPIDPEAIETAARAAPDDLELLRLSVRAWLAAAGRELGAARWEPARRLAERALMMLQKAPLDEAGPGGRFAPEAALVEMALARIDSETGRKTEAAGRYREAGKIGGDPRAFSSAGELAAELEDWGQAARDFEAALERPGANPTSWLRLAEVRYQLGETSQAIEAAEKGLEAGAPAEAARALLERFRRESAVESDFHRMGTHKFSLTFSGLPEQTAHRDRVLASLERVYDRVCRFLGRYPATAVAVVVYPSGSSYREASGAPSWSAAAYNGKIRVPTGELDALSDEALDRVLAHELGHYLIERLAGPRCPAWVQEGLAQHAEADGAAPVWMAGAVRPYLKKWEAGKPPPFSLKELEARFHGSSGGGVHLAYAASYYAVKALLADGQMFRLESFLARLEQGADLEEALASELFTDYPALDLRWVAQARADLDLAR